MGWSRQEMLSRVLEMVKRAGLENDPALALKQLLDDVIKETAARCGRLYLLHLATSAYVQFTSPVKPYPQPRINLLDLPKDADEDVLRQAIAQRRIVRVQNTAITSPNHATSSVRSRLVVPIVRDNVCVGVFDLDSDQPDHFSSQHEETLQVAALVALLLCELEDVLSLLKALPTPVDYQQPFDQFLDDMITLVATASGLPLIALRELRDDTLYCLKSYGFETLKEDDLHISPYNDYPTFRQAIETRTTKVEHRVDKEHVRRQLDDLKVLNVKSFVVVPVCVGKDLFGTLSFAVKCEHEYTALEQSGLETIANAVGVAIANYRNFHLAEERMYQEARIGAAITTVDVAQSARHEARNFLESCQENLVLLKTMDGNTVKQRNEQRKLIDEISQELKEAEQALQKIKTVTKPPEREVVSVRIEELWREAFALVTARLQQNDIKYHIAGTASTRGAKDYLRHAFLHLILNSIDAFKESKRKRERRIEVTIDAHSGKTFDLTIRYVDNATGIDPSKLKPSPNEGLHEVKDIFLPGITSKEEGSGYGMYLARKIFADHKGSIELVDHRNGVVFQISLPKRD
jgi:putative methionine-R-sulfoxide reductase with GAF domain/nitrogen-specific signal transduction histidine kinase